MAYISQNPGQSQIFSGISTGEWSGSWNSNISGCANQFLGPTMGPSMFGPAMFGMDPFGGFSTSLMGQVLMNFLQGPAPFASHCPNHQATGLHQPHLNMPYGARPEEAEDRRELPSPPPRPQLAQPRQVRPQIQPAKPQAKPQVSGKTEAKPTPPAKTGQPQAKAGPSEAKPGQSQVQTKPAQTQGQTAAKPGQPEAKAQPQAKPGPAKPQFDASKTASGLHKAMHGGLFGAGTDEDAIFKALEGRSPDEIKQIRAHYKEHYKRDLDADFKSEMSGKDLSRTQSLMKGDSAAANATALRQAMGGLGTDEKAVFSTLDGKSAKEREQIAAEYKKQTGRTLQADLKGDLSGSDLDRANALLKGDTAKSDAAKLRGAMAGLGTDEASIMKTLEGKSAKEREAIVNNYKKMYGTDLSKALKSELSGSQLTEAKALLAGDTVKADAAKLRTAMAGMGTDEDAINAVFAGKSAEERAKIQQEYKSTYGTDLHKALGKELSGNDLAKTKILMEQGKLSDAQELKFAMEGMGTDEATVKRTLEGKSKEEIAKLKEDYRKETGRELTDDLKSDMTGRDLFDATQALKGKPTTLEESVERLNERHQYERGGDSNSFGRGVVDLFSDHGERLDQNVTASNESLQRVRDLESQGRTQEAAAERARLERLVGYSNADVESVREAKDSAADVAGTTAATVAGVVVIAATAGTATPLVAAGLAAATGGSARVLVSGAIQGEAYGLEQGFSDFGRGAIDGGTAIIGAGSGRVATTAVTETAEAVARNRILSTGVRQGIRDGVVEGTVGGAAQALIDEKTWDGDFASGVTNVLTQSAIGATAGGVAGGGMAHAMETGSAAIRGVRESFGGGGGGGSRTVNEFGAELREQGWQIKADDRNAAMVGDIHGREVMFEVTDPNTGQVSTRRGVVDAQDLEGNSSMFSLRGQEGEFNNNFIDNMAVRPKDTGTATLAPGKPSSLRNADLEAIGVSPETASSQNMIFMNKPSDAKEYFDNLMGDKKVRLATAGYSAPPDGYEGPTTEFLSGLTRELKDDVGFVTSPTADKGSIDAITSAVGQSSGSPIGYVTADPYLGYVNPSNFPAGIDQAKFASQPKFTFPDAETYSQGTAELSNSFLVTGGRNASVSDFQNAIRNGNQIVVLTNANVKGGSWDVGKGRVDNASSYLHKMISGDTDGIPMDHAFNQDVAKFLSENKETVNQLVRFVDANDPGAVRQAAEHLRAVNPKTGEALNVDSPVRFKSSQTDASHSGRVEVGMDVEPAYMSEIKVLESRYPGVVDKLKDFEIEAAAHGYSPQAGKAMETSVIDNAPWPQTTFGDPRTNIGAKAKELQTTNPALNTGDASKYDFAQANQVSIDLMEKFDTMFSQEKFPGIAISTRAKTPHSLTNKMTKMVEKDPNYTLAHLTDTVGARIDAPDLRSMGTIAKELEKQYEGKIIAKSDYVSKPGENGYRAIHYIIEIDGRMVEIQTSTTSLRVADLATHDTVYKAEFPVSPETSQELSTAADRIMFLECLKLKNSGGG